MGKNVGKMGIKKAGEAVKPHPDTLRLRRNMLNSMVRVGDTIRNYSVVKSITAKQCSKYKRESVHEITKEVVIDFTFLF